MNSKKSRKIFVNLPVRNLEKTKAFFSALGFEYNPQFTDQNAACMVLSEEGFVMLLQQEYFKTFTKAELADTSKVTEALFAISCDSRAEVETMFNAALANGGRAAMPAQDHGFMYSCSFYDLDSHHWEIVWMDASAVQQQ